MINETFMFITSNMLFLMDRQNRIEWWNSLLYYRYRIENRQEFSFYTSLFNYQFSGSSIQRYWISFGDVADFLSFLVRWTTNYLDNYRDDLFIELKRRVNIDCGNACWVATLKRTWGRLTVRANWKIQTRSLTKNWN